MDGYEAVMQVAREHERSWLHVIGDIHDEIGLRLAAGDDAIVDVRVMRDATGRAGYPSLAPLARWGVLTRRERYANDIKLRREDGRKFYEMSDREGVCRALNELRATPSSTGRGIALPRRALSR